MPVRAPVPAQPRHDPVQRPDAPIVCYHCKQEGHIKPECPHRKPKYSSHSCIPRPGEGSAGFMGRLQTLTVMVNGNRATALLDSGSTQTLVQPHLLEKRDYIQGRRLKVLCVNGDEHDYPVADVYLEVQGQIYQVTVGVVERLSHPVVIGQDIVVLPELLQNVQPVNLVMTRAQCKTQAQQKDEDDTNATDMHELAFAQADITPPARVKPRKTRRQRRQARLVGSVEENLPCVSSEDDWGEVADNFEQLQREDGTLKVAFERATHDGATAPVVTDLSGEFYVVREGLLYHQPAEGRPEQLVVPTKLRGRVLEMGHDIPWSGHLSLSKTYDRIAARFYWPGLYTDVQRFCKSCPTCQLTSNRRTSPYPLQPLPVIETPFSRIAMDLVGPLERTQTGHKYILVIGDYATRYPEASPLRRIAARPIAQALLHLFFHSSTVQFRKV
ncbi:hypothetical protein ACEWY4_010261 [Coilia grayii]|uniref:Gypsy retrotransposon integrase-like protein 1 n=1 Tax=Coilia grayii TaxID=363190 RepID=A0ABD1K1D3_9TELE